MSIQAPSPDSLEHHKIVSEQEWVAARQELLRKEKEMSRAMDDLSRQRRELPWTRVDKNYVFEGPNGKETLSDLFGKNNQLLIYHFMFGPDWKEGCVGCSMVSDHFDGANLHLKHRDVSLVAVSRAPYEEFQAFKKRMGWQFKWVSSAGTNFNYDYGVSFHREDLDKGDVDYNYKVQKINSEELPGASVFYKNAKGEIFHTYSTYERGLDILVGVDNFLDLTPKGRDDGEDGWWKHHDRYEDAP